MPRKMNYRVKIIEIEIKDNGIFCKTIPYKDARPKKEDKMFNFEQEFEIIKRCMINLKKSVSYEKIDALNEIELERMNIREFTAEQ